MLFKTSSRVNMIGALIGMICLLLITHPAHAEQVNGEYTIGFNILHADQKNASIAEGYWEQPAKVFIKDDQFRVQTTINKHAWVTEFAVNENGSMKEVKTLSVDEAADLRVTEFQVANLTDLVESKVSVYIEEIDYDHSYTMYFKFNPDTLTLVQPEETQTSVETQGPEVTDEPESAASELPPSDTSPAEPEPEVPTTSAPSSTDTQESPDTPVTTEEPEDSEESEPVASSSAPSDIEESSDAEESTVQDSSQIGPAEATAVGQADNAETETPTEAVAEESNSNMSAAIIMIPIVIFILMTVIAVMIYRKNREEA